MRYPARWIALGVGVVVATLGVVLATQVGSSPTYRSGALLGKPAPALDLPVLDGNGARVRLADYTGKTVIVNFWNSWCIPCQQEEAALADFHTRHASDPTVVLLGVVRDDTTAEVRRYVHATGMDWTVALDPGSRAALDFGTTGQPETYAISPDGVVSGKQLGRVSADNLESLLAAAQRG